MVYNHLGHVSGVIYDHNSYVVTITSAMSLTCQFNSQSHQLCCSMYVAAITPAISVYIAMLVVGIQSHQLYVSVVKYAFNLSVSGCGTPKKNHLNNTFTAAIIQYAKCRAALVPWHTFSSMVYIHLYHAT